MERSSARPADGAEQILRTYGDMLYRICLVTLKNEADAEDAVQDVLIRWMEKRIPFSSAEHEKAWLIRVAVNRCRDMLRRHHRQEVSLEEIPALSRDPEPSPVLAALLEVPEKFRTVLTLHYIEGYSVAEIAGLIGITGSGVKMRLQKGRHLLEQALEKEKI